MRTRKNPYPEFEYCDEAMDCLVREILDIDLEEASPAFGDQLVQEFQKRRSIPQFILDFEKIRSLEDIKTFQKHLTEYRGYWRVIYLLTHLQVPAVYMMADIEILEDIDFIHTFPQSRYASIKEHGLYGRMDPSRIALTRDLSDVYIKGNGYIFGYESAQFMHGQGTVVDFSTHLRGKARKALSFHFLPDNEKQLIIPVKCIDSYTISEDADREDLSEEELIAEDLLADPLRLELYAPYPCDRCNSETILDEHSFVGSEVLCETCRRRRNPGERDSLYFRYGFWDLEPNTSMIYHVTPRLSELLTAGELAPRLSRGAREQTLGGPHSVSLSFYGSLDFAFYTAMYLYRIWQVKHGYLSFEDLRSVAGWSELRVKMMRRKGVGSAIDLVGKVAATFNMRDPIVKDDSWADDITEEDFAVLAFRNPCRHLYVERLHDGMGESSVTEPLQQKSMVDLGGIVSPLAYFSPRRLEGLFEGTYGKTFPYDNIYPEIKKSILEGSTTFGIDLGYKDKSLEYQAFFEEIFGSLDSNCPKEWYGKDLIQFQNITIDLRPQDVCIEDLCRYRSEENELQLFRKMPLKNLQQIYTIQDILQIAREQAGGEEPFLWGLSPQKYKGR